MKKLLTVLFILFISQFLLKSETDTLSTDDLNSIISYQKSMDSLDKTIKYQTGEVKIKDFAKLTIPKGYKYIPKDKADMIVYELWGNQKTDETQGMIVKEDWSLAQLSSWAFIITYDESGFIKDDEADDINYDDMAKDLKESIEEGNADRKKEGYSEQFFLGWASKPFYDKTNKILHWAKSIKFGKDAEDTTLNYDVRILGRKGFLSLNAVGTIDQLEDIKSHIPQIIHIAKFEKGHTYFDFNADTDEIAAYGLGGLIGAKVLAKAGILALLLKNIKLIFIGIAVFFSGFWSKIKGFFSKKKDQEQF